MLTGEGEKTMSEEASGILTETPKASTRAAEQLEARGHKPGQHLFEHRRAERINVDFERVCVGFSAEPGGCGKLEIVGQTCLVCDNEGVRERGVVVPFELRGDDGARDIGPLCALCLVDFRRAKVVAGVRMVNCVHDPVRGVCRWCGEPA